MFSQGRDPALNTLLIFFFHKFVPGRTLLKKHSFEEIVWKQFDLYPEMEIRDLYKLIFQGVMGSGHAVSSSENARNWLLSEIGNTGASPHKETLIEEISPGGAVVRVNLRPFLSMQKDPDKLLRAFVRTGREFKGDTVLLQQAWKQAEAVQSVFPLIPMRDFINRQRETGFQAVHHSQTYRDLYRPAYRVVSREILHEEEVVT